MTAKTARENAKLFPHDALWQDHCARVAAYLDHVEATGQEPPLSPAHEAQVARATTTYASRVARERDLGMYQPFTGLYMTEEEYFGQ